MSVHRLIATFIAFLALLVSTTTANASASLSPLRAQSAWTGAYWNNTDFAGQAVVTRVDGSIDFSWGHGSPDYRINSDHFAARWTRWVSFAQGDYRFSATTENGVRCYFDGNLLINKWYTHGAQTYEANVT